MDNQIKIDELKFDEKGLIPAVVIEAGTHKLLMVAWMNRESRLTVTAIHCRSSLEKTDLPATREMNPASLNPFGRAKNSLTSLSKI